MSDVPEAVEPRCACFGDSGLQASTYGSADGLRRCDLCGRPVQEGSVTALEAINAVPVEEAPSRSIWLGTKRDPGPLDPWVRVMADYCSDGLWRRDGCMFCRHHLPVSTALLRRHEAWCDAYEASSSDALDGTCKNGFDMAAHSAEGLLIAQAIKRELPGWTVIYFNESLCRYTPGEQPRGEFESEVELDHG